MYVYAFLLVLACPSSCWLMLPECCFHVVFQPFRYSFPMQRRDLCMYTRLNTAYCKHDELQNVGKLANRQIKWKECHQKKTKEEYEKCVHIIMLYLVILRDLHTYIHRYDITYTYICYAYKYLLSFIKGCHEG